VSALAAVLRSDISGQDPPVRTNGKCAGTACKKVRPKLAIVAGDPFCSAECCRKFYGVTSPWDKRANARANAKS
jgi:hypothetical protein